MCKHLSIDKPMFTTETAVSSAQILGLGSKLNPSNMQCMFNKDHILFHAESLSRAKSTKQKKDSVDRVGTSMVKLVI